MTTKKLDMQDVKRCLKRAAETAEGTVLKPCLPAFVYVEASICSSFPIHSSSCTTFHQNIFYTFPQSLSVFMSNRVNTHTKCTQNERQLG